MTLNPIDLASGQRARLEARAEVLSSYRGLEFVLQKPVDGIVNYYEIEVTIDSLGTLPGYTYSTTLDRDTLYYYSGDVVGYSDATGFSGEYDSDQDITILE